MLPNINSILYCTDLSGNSLFAFRYAAALAKMADADIHVLHVIESLSQDAVITIEAFIQDPAKRKEVIYKRKKRAEELLNERQDDFWNEIDAADRGLRSRVKSLEVVEAYPAETILDKSVELGCDLIIMGGHDRGISHNFLGSVAMSVLRRSNIPAMIVPLPNV